MNLCYRISLLIFAVFGFIFIGCKEKKIINTKSELLPPLPGIWEGYYPDFYNDRLNFELKNNARTLNAKVIYYYMLNDSSNLAIFKKIHVNKKEKIVLQIIEKRRGLFTSYIFFKYLYTDILNIDFNILQIEYPLSSSGRKKMMIIAENNYNDSIPMKSIYIQWSSIPIDLTRNDDNAYSENYHYMWGINKTTDTITTNLDFKIIKAIFPEFQGIYKFHKFKEIIVDYSYPTKDVSFYQNILFSE